MEGIVGKITLGIIRHFLSGSMAGMIAKGYLDKSTSEQAVGAAMFLITIGFSVYDKIHAGQRLDAAKVAPAEPDYTP